MNCELRVVIDPMMGSDLKLDATLWVHDEVARKIIKIVSKELDYRGRE